MLDEMNFDAVTKGLTTKADKIRALARSGVSTADIARHLDIRYQHARNVLVQSGMHKSQTDVKAEQQDDTVARDAGHWTTIDMLGKVKIPEHLLREAGIQGNEPLYVGVREGALELLSRRTALRRAQQLLAPYAASGKSIVDEFIADRRREAEHE